MLKKIMLLLSLMLFSGLLYASDESTEEMSEDRLDYSLEELLLKYLQNKAQGLSEQELSRLQSLNFNNTDNVFFNLGMNKFCHEQTNRLICDSTKALNNQQLGSWLLRPSSLLDNNIRAVRTLVLSVDEETYKSQALEAPQASSAAHYILNYRVFHIFNRGFCVSENKEATARLLSGDFDNLKGVICFPSLLSWFEHIVAKLQVDLSKFQMIYR